MFRSSVKGWRAIVGEYVLDNTDFLLKLIPEIEFVSKSADLIDKLAGCEGCTLSFPTEMHALIPDCSAYGE